MAAVLSLRTLPCATQWAFGTQLHLIYINHFLYHLSPPRSSTIPPYGHSLAPICSPTPSFLSAKKKSIIGS
ncbi:hypothetical protein XENTR_v10003198 [Xenopus tropicalis]|nr:hypothetical protein XENTR_v10003198 [Xenopus tropicalis]